MKNIFKYILIVLASSSCGNSDKELQEFPSYTGPIQQAADMVLYHSESGVVKTKLVTPKLLEYASGDREFPEGVYIELFEEGVVTSTLKANEAYYFKEDDYWRGLGDVVVENKEKKQKLSTEELFWEPKKEEIHTEKFVAISGPDLATSGWGLEAKQDFSEYHIKKPHKGTLLIDE